MYYTYEHICDRMLNCFQELLASKQYINLI